MAVLVADRAGRLGIRVGLIQYAEPGMDPRAPSEAPQIVGLVRILEAEVGDARRRAKQEAHNLEQGITPQGLNKKIADIMEGAGGGGRGRRKAERPGQKAAEEAEQYRAKAGNRSPEEVLKEVSRLEDEMYKAASELDFETAARLRDDIAELKEAALRTG